MTAQNYQQKYTRLIDRPEFFEFLTVKTNISVREWLYVNEESNPRRKKCLASVEVMAEKVFSKDVFVCRFIVMEFLIWEHQ